MNFRIECKECCRKTLIKIWFVHTPPNKLNSWKSILLKINTNPLANVKYSL